MRESVGRAFSVAVFLAFLAAAGGPIFGQTTVVPAAFFHTITPCRLYDSRAGDGSFEPGEQRELQVATACGIPAAATAVALNLTAVSPAATGNFVLFPDPLQPTLSNALSFKAGVTVAGSGIYPLSRNGLGTLSVLANLTAGSVHLVLDVSGYFLSGTGGETQFPAIPICPSATTGVKAVDCWEGKVSLTGSASNFPPLDAYRRVRIRIDFKQNGEPRHSTYAYWDGGLSYAFRTAFPFQGSWSWTAVCESCLDRTLAVPAQGTVTVVRRRSSPVLYSRGSLSVHPSGRFLQHQTGIKFFWLGDTAWGAPMRTYSVANSGSTWTTYLEQRATLPNGTVPPPSAPTAGKYTVVQVSLAFHVGAGGYADCASGSACVRIAKRSAFTTTGPLGQVPSPRSYWNPEYWRNLDNLVYQANQQGLVVVLTGVMDPFGSPPSIGGEEDVKIFARNLAARMAGFFVVYSVGWDNRIDNETYLCGNEDAPRESGFTKAVVNGFAAHLNLAKMKAVGRELDLAAPGQLITSHLGGGTPFFGGDSTYHDPGPNGENAALASPYSYLHREPWLDLHLFQSSQCDPERPSVFQHQGTARPSGACDPFVAEAQLACVMRRARTMPAKFLSLKANDTPLPGPPALVKPAVNGEARYEVTVLTGQPPVQDIAYQCRHAGYVTLLSGAAGYTGGVVNVEEWRWPADGMGLTGSRAGKCPQQLKYVGLLQEGQVMEWERLRRKEAMLRNAGTDENERSVVAASESNQTIVAYLPERVVEDQKTLELAINQSVYVGFDTCRWSKIWWNPINGDSKPVTANQIQRLPRVCDSGETAPCTTFQFKPPQCVGIELRPNDRCDWALALRDLGSCQAGSRNIQVWSSLDELGRNWGIFIQPSTSLGETTGPITQISPLTASVQANPKVAASEYGSMVVWIGEDDDGEGYGVWARSLDATGVPIGVIQRVSDSSQGDHVSPTVAAIGESGYVVAWNLYSEDSDRGEIYARFLDPGGLPLTPAFRVNVTTVGQQGYPQVAADAAGNVLIAWESWGQDGDGNGVFARRYDSAHLASEEFQVHQSGAGWQYLTGAELDSSGGFEVRWQVYTPNGSDLGTWGQRISLSGPPRNGTEFSISGPESE